MARPHRVIPLLAAAVTTLVFCGVLAVARAAPPKASAKTPAKSSAKSGPKSATSSKSTPKSGSASFKADDAVEVREGDLWSPAIVLAREGRRYQIRYEDGTEEWVATDRVRAPGGEAGNAAEGDGKNAPAKPIAAKPPDSFKSGAKVEVKWGNRWSPAVVKNRDGELYLIVYDKWETQFHWEWVHVSMVRKPGSAKVGPRFGRGV